jgi:hypothetical protein
MTGYERFCSILARQVHRLPPSFACSCRDLIQEKCNLCQQAANPQKLRLRFTTFPFFTAAACNLSLIFSTTSNLSQRAVPMLYTSDNTPAAIRAPHLLQVLELSLSNRHHPSHVRDHHRKGQDNICQSSQRLPQHPTAEYEVELTVYECRD